MIYGAYGYAGALITEEAVRRGHRPVVAGRSADRLIPLAKRFGLDPLVIDLKDETTLAKAAAECSLVLHAAGPFAETSAPMVRACLSAGTHYVDITGEVQVFEEVFARDPEAKTKGITLLPGAGFDVVAGDCLAKYVADKVSEATRLDLAVAAMGRVSPGTARTMIQQFPRGMSVRREGRLMTSPFGEGARTIPFPGGVRQAVTATLGELAAVYWTTGIPTLTTYMVFPSPMIGLMRWTGPMLQRLLASDSIRRVAERGAKAVIRGPNAEARQKGRSSLWARASDEKGNAAEAWLETAEAYAFTAMSAVRCVEGVLKKHPTQGCPGACTPAGAFGAGFVLEIPGTRRLDRLS
jgi:short subunit dehydrogenase-like uncharacterized protein